MNRIKIIMLSMLAVAVLFSSCKDDETDDTVITPSGPILNLDPESIEAWVGDEVAIEFTVSTASANEIISLEITTNETEIESVFFGEELDNNFVNDSIVFTMPAGPAGNPWVNGGFFDVTFVATHDVDGIQYTTTKVVTCTYVEPENQLVDEFTGILNNIVGPNEGAYNLVLNTTVAAAGDNATKDMIHVTDGLSDTFNPEWTVGAANGTSYVLANGIDYDNVTLEDAVAVYGDGSTAMTDVTFVEGEVFVARLRGGTEGYAVIRIDQINIVVGNNQDNMVFSYKK